MLDQNTDRMWYVIGAVLVGAAIILIANGTLPQMFASVSENFEEVAYKGIQGIDMVGEDPVIYENVLNPQYITPRAQNVVPGSLVYDSTNHILYVDTMYASEDLSGITRVIDTHSADNPLILQYGDSYTFSYEIKSPIDLTIRNDVNVRGMGTDGSVVVWNSNNSDDVPARVINGRRAGENAKDFIPNLKVRAGKWTKMTVSIRNSSELNIDNLPIRGNMSIGFYEEIDDLLSLEFRNIKGEFNDRASAFIPYGVSPDSLDE